MLTTVQRMTEYTKMILHCHLPFTPDEKFVYQKIKLWYIYGAQELASYYEVVKQI